MSATSDRDPVESEVLAVDVRRARIEEGERLREIARSSKGYWGYDAELVNRWADGLDFSESALDKKEFYAIEVAGRVAGWAALIPKGAVCWLDDLWIEPTWIGKGMGTVLFRAVVKRARELQASRLEWEAERHSIGFYEKMGGRYLRDSEPGVWGRISPVMGLDLIQE